MDDRSQFGFKGKNPPQVHDETELTIHDVTSEAWRTYTFENGKEYTIAEPRKLWVKRKADGDSHRVLDAKGIVHYIKAGWFVLRWKTRPDCKTDVAF